MGTDHSLAICVGNLSTRSTVSSALITYDDSLDECTEIECDEEGCLDDSPDANAGDTIWGDGLGDDWDCTIQALAGDYQASQFLEPMRAGVRPHRGRARPQTWDEAWISCHADGEIAASTLGDDETYGALAVLNAERRRRRYGLRRASTSSGSTVTTWQQSGRAA